MCLAKDCKVDYLYLGAQVFTSGEVIRLWGFFFGNPSTVFHLKEKFAFSYYEVIWLSVHFYYITNSKEERIMLSISNSTNTY